MTTVKLQQSCSRLGTQSFRPIAPCQAFKPGEQVAGNLGKVSCLDRCIILEINSHKQIVVVPIATAMDVFKAKDIGAHHFEVVDAIDVGSCEGKVDLLGTSHDCEGRIENPTGHTETLLD